MSVHGASATFSERPRDVGETSTNGSTVTTSNAWHGSIRRDASKPCPAKQQSPLSRPLGRKRPLESIDLDHVWLCAGKDELNEVGGEQSEPEHLRDVGLVDLLGCRQLGDRRESAGFY